MAEKENLQPLRNPHKLILCFDGTGNTSNGSSADTNVVKLLQKFDRNHPDQYHYYQTGIGTYVISEDSISSNPMGRVVDGVRMTIDAGLATTFDAHIMSGYRFLMRYYNQGDKIYMFGFSRGAYTAKFLARMVYHVGLLCRGNEEMVPFAFDLYRRSLEGTRKYQEELLKAGKRGLGHLGDRSEEEREIQTRAEYKYSQLCNEVTSFRMSFCKIDPTREGDEFQRIKVFFLGLWDCVSSVSLLESGSPVPLPSRNLADHVRHAVSVDERRVKFKPALLVQDAKDPDEDILEVWFPGNHGDVGGGWPAQTDLPVDTPTNGNTETSERLTVRHLDDGLTRSQRLKFLFTSQKPREATYDPELKYAFQLSDVPLSWMIQELENIPELEEEGKKNWGVAWSSGKDEFKRRWDANKHNAFSGPTHDTLAVGGGCGFFQVLFWKFMEVWPFTMRWELKKGKWVNTRFPLNRGACRDMPAEAILHQSLKRRLEDVDDYRPHNNHGDGTHPCLKDSKKKWVVRLDPHHPVIPDPKADHNLYKFSEVQEPRSHSNGNWTKVLAVARLRSKARAA